MAKGLVNGGEREQNKMKRIYLMPAMLIMYTVIGFWLGFSGHCRSMKLVDAERQIDLHVADLSSSRTGLTLSIVFSSVFWVALAIGALELLARIVWNY